MGYRYLLKEFRSRPINICINCRIKFIQVIVQDFFRTFGQQEMTSNIAMHYLDSPTASGSDLLVQQQIPSTFTTSLCSSESRHCSAIQCLPPSKVISYLQRQGCRQSCFCLHPVGPLQFTP